LLRRDRLWLLACCLLLALLPFATAPGDIIADTKFELAVNPAGFLSGALTLWNPQQFGLLLNQAVGYLFPMGPFFELLRLLGTAGWIVQRLWLSALLLVAFGGTVRLAGRMGVGTPGTRLAAGLAYALSPAALSMLGQTSGEFLPMALLPWIIVPLADSGAWTGTGGAVFRARAVARSAVAAALCSGMNAASTIAVLVPVVLYILTRRGHGGLAPHAGGHRGVVPRGQMGPGRGFCGQAPGGHGGLAPHAGGHRGVVPRGQAQLRMLAWWLPAVALVTSSWSVPLVLLSKYGVSIVPFTESAQVTSSTTSLLNILRGTENWIGYQATSGQPGRPLAFLLATGVLPAVLTGLLAALGLAGLVHREMKERRFLLWSVLGGVVIISLGYVSSLGNPLEGPLIALINGPASPLRNLWKFDPMIRLPLALGFAHLMALSRAARPRAALSAVAAVALGGLAVPAVSTGLASPGSFGRVPAYWVAAADWLTAHAGNQAVLVEPGAAFGEYTWGSPMDDVLQGLTNVDWAGRNLEAVGSVGNERLLDAVDQQFAAGDGSAGLTMVLARMGVKYVLVRNDLTGAALAGTWPARIHDALAASGGLSLAAQFGPAVGGGTPDNAVAGFDARYRAVQVYQVAGAQAAAVVQPAAGTLRVYGAPESMVTLANEGLLNNHDDGPVLINDDGADEPVVGSVVTDSLRRRTVNFGELRTNYSPTLTASQPADTFLSADDYTEPDWSKYQAVARYNGIKNVTASSSASDITTFASQWSTGRLPAAAFDGNTATFWESGAFNGPFGQWIRVLFAKKVRFTGADTIQVAFADNPAIGPPVTKVTVSTAAGQVTDPVRLTGDLQPLPVPAGASGWLRITVTGLDAPPSYPLFGTQVGIASVVVPGVSASRTIVAPTVPVTGGDPSAVVLAKAQPRESSCMLTSVRWVCSPELATATEEQYGFDHSFSAAFSQQATLRGSALLTDSSLADKYALAGRDQPAVTASSTFIADPQDQPLSAFDGNAATAWVASPADPQPRLTIDWGHPRTVSRVTIERPPGASGVTQVLITGSAGQLRGAMISANGVVAFAPMKTSSLALTFTTPQAPLSVSEVVIGGVPAVRTPAGSFRLACGLGPRLTVDGKPVATEVTGSYADLLAGRPLRFTACRAVTLAAGPNRVTESGTDAFDVQDVVLGTPGVSGVAGPTAATVLSWTQSSRTLRVAAAARSYLEVNENFNAGWQAVLAGRQLRPVRLDGWKQAWVLPAGASGVVTLTYQPQALYRDAVVGGLAALALIIGVALALALPRRRARRPLPWFAAPPEASLPSRRGRELRWPGLARWRRLAQVAILGLCLAAAGLVLGGYPGAILLPVVTGALGIPAGGRRALSAPYLLGALLGALLAAASVVGAIGEHLEFSGATGWFVVAAANAIPQVTCLIVVGGLAAALCRPPMGQAVAGHTVAGQTVTGAAE
jgi:arabinofuranan 3-O-arabinosyltransferase